MVTSWLTTSSIGGKSGSTDIINNYYQSITVIIMYPSVGSYTKKHNIVASVYLKRSYKHEEREVACWRL